MGCTGFGMPQQGCSIEDVCHLQHSTRRGMELRRQHNFQRRRRLTEKDALVLRMHEQQMSLSAAAVLKRATPSKMRQPKDSLS